MNYPNFRNGHRIRITGRWLSGSIVISLLLLFASAKPFSLIPDDEPKNEFDFNFTIKDLEENKIDFTGFKWKVVFLNLWATWCGPCRMEMAGIQKLYDKTDHDKVSFIMLSIDRDGDRPKVADYIKKKGFTFPAYLPSG